MREITEQQARQVLDILIEHCGFRVADAREGDIFCETIRWPNSNTSIDHREYRFIGLLGFGGKFRNNGNRDNVPYVDCYPEHQTPSRLTMIEAANTQLRNLFTAAPLHGYT